MKKKELNDTKTRDAARIVTATEIATDDVTTSETDTATETANEIVIANATKTRRRDVVVTRDDHRRVVQDATATRISMRRVDDLVVVVVSVIATLESQIISDIALVVVDRGVKRIQSIKKQVVVLTMVIIIAMRNNKMESLKVSRKRMSKYKMVRFSLV